MLEKNLKGETMTITICPTVAENLDYQNRKWIWNDNRVYINDLRDSTLHETIKIYQEGCSVTKELKYRKHENDNKCMISELAFSGRHANHSCWILSQKYNSVLKKIQRAAKRNLFKTTTRKAFKFGFKK